MGECGTNGERGMDQDSEPEKRLVGVKKVEGGSRWGVWIKVSDGSYKTIRGIGVEEAQG